MCMWFVTYDIHIIMGYIGIYVHVICHLWHAHNHGCYVLMVASPTKFQRFSFLHPKNTIKIGTTLDYNTSWNFRNINIANRFKLVHALGNVTNIFWKKLIFPSYFQWELGTSMWTQLCNEEQMNWKSFGNTSENFDNKLQSWCN
jgi:hypothetical protein